MTDFTIPCEVFARLAKIADGPSDWFKSVRLDDGLAIATNRKIMAVERVGDFKGVVHILTDAALVAQCEEEAKYASNLTITVNEVLKYAVAKTTLGYVHTANCAVWLDVRSDFDKWREVVTVCRTPATASKGGMYWTAEVIAKLGKASPSGFLVFEEMIDTTRHTIIRDVNDPNWLGIFAPYPDDANNYPPATLPGWV